MSCKRINPLFLLASLGALITLVASRTAAADGATGYPEPIVQWGVQPGETCEDISKALYGSPAHVSLILRYNRVACTRGAPLAPGLTLVLPAKITSVPTARITSVNPETRARPGGGSWTTAVSGQPLTSNANINTLAAGRAAIQFRDRTRIYMASNTLVVIYDTASQTAVSKTRPANVELQQGELQAGLAALRGEDSVEVAVKGGGRVSASSRDAVVAKKGARTTVSVFDGRAKVANAGASVQVPKNFGTRFVEKKVPEKPRPLPPAPSWLSGGSNIVVFADAEGALLRAAWSDVSRAARYRIEVSRNADFTDLVVRQEVPKDVRAFRAEKMPLGPYFLRVRAIDADDFLGISSAVRSLRVISSKWTRGQGRFDSDAVEAGRYASVSFGNTSGYELALDGGAFGPMPDKLDFARLAPNTLRVRRAGQAEVVELPVKYQEVTATLKANLADERLDIEVTFDNLGGIDPATVLKPRVRIVGPDGSIVLPLTRNASGKWMASQPAKSGDYRIAVLGVGGNVLGVSDLRQDAPKPEPVKPPAKPAPLPLIGPSVFPLGVNQRTNIMMFAPTPHRQATLSGTIASADGLHFQGQTHATGAIGPLGLEALIRTRTTDSQGILGDTSAWLGARYRVFRLGRADLELAPNVRIGIPLDDEGPPLRIEGGLGAGGLAGDFSWLVNLGARLRPANDAARAFADAANVALLGGGSYHATQWLRISAMLDAQLLFETDATYAFGVGGGIEMGTSIFGALTVRGGYEPFRQPSQATDADPSDKHLLSVAGQLAFGVRLR